MFSDIADRGWVLSSPSVSGVCEKSAPLMGNLFKLLTDLTPLDQTDCCPAVAVFMHVLLFSTYQYSFFVFFTYSATKWPVATPFFARSQTDPVHRLSAPPRSAGCSRVLLHRFADLGEIISFLSTV